MKAEVYSIEGKRVKEIELPEVFREEYHPNLIKRAVISIQSARMQAKGTKPEAGRQTTATYIGMRGLPPFRRTINVDKARKPRTKHRRELLYGDVRGIPGVVKGPRAHPPKAEKILIEKINRKEKRKALDSAIAATAKIDLVKKRSHKVKEGTKLPLVIEEKFEELKKTREVIEVLKKLFLIEDVERAKKRKSVRAGKGKKRGRRYKKAKSILIVTGSKKKENPVFKAARNIEGIDVIQLRNLNAELLAPGAQAGRLTLWTENAIKELGERNQK